MNRRRETDAPPHCGPWTKRIRLAGKTQATVTIERRGAQKKWATMRRKLSENQRLEGGGGGERWRMAVAEAHPTGGGPHYHEQIYPEGDGGAAHVYLFSFPNPRSSRTLHAVEARAAAAAHRGQGRRGAVGRGGHGPLGWDGNWCWWVT